MAHRTTSFLSALVALNIQLFTATAAPLNAQDVFWVTSTSVISVEATVTNFITPVKPSDRAMLAPPLASTVTRWETTTVTPSPTKAWYAASTATPAAWTLSQQFNDLSPFDIKKLAFGSRNIAVVTGIPASASASGAPPSAASADAASPASTPLPRLWANSSSAYRVLYPSGSINPGNRPQGGAEFYAPPGNLQFESASNVTLEYSVFFPVDFEWVKGGKLPGLYGGHEGCSGGNSAKSCFSTRLMWRTGGAGELYLYAPKDKQTPELCNAPPQSVCDAAYGLSVGRGSFHFAAGRWTHVSQTVRLNTPGKQDGGFELLVNGQRIMRRDDVFYRDVDQNDGDGSGDGEENGRDQDLWRRGLLESITGEDALLPPLLPLVSGVVGALGNVAGPLLPLALGKPTAAATKTLTSTVTAPSPAATASPPFNVQAASQGAKNEKAVGFSGLFFSTFFGGHEQAWASPKDQYTWFKDFGMSINA